MAWSIIVDYTEGNTGFGTCLIETNHEGVCRLTVDQVRADILNDLSSSSTSSDSSTSSEGYSSSSSST